MNVAARFPIKPNLFLLRLVIVLHLLVFLIGLTLLTSFMSILITLVGISFSCFYSYQEYSVITNACDDLCWSGESWLMHTNPSHTEKASMNYCLLLETSWITPYFCFLKFNQNNHEKAWFFTPNSLGYRLFSELCYLARHDIKKTEKEQLLS